MPKFNTDQILNKVIRYGDRLTGNTKRKLDNAVHVLSNAHNLGIYGIPQSSIRRAQHLAKKEGETVFKTRITTGAVVGAVGATGFLGLHKYHQHKDNKILERIDNMYKTK